MFPKAANLAVFKNYNEAISGISSDCSNLNIKEDEEKPLTAYGDVELNSDTAYASLVRQRSWIQMLTEISIMSMHQCLSSNYDKQSYAGMLLDFKQL